MTVLSTESRLVAGVTATLPRVNLLPPEIAERATVRKVKVGLGCAVVATLGVVGLVYMMAASSASSAQTSLDAAKTQGVSLQAENAKYRYVTDTQAAATAAQAQLTTAMGEEVQYSQLLNDLSLSVPTTVWLKNISYVQVPAGLPTAAGVGATANSVGAFTVTGVGFSHDDLAVWLESVAGLKTYSNPYFANSTEGLIGTRKTVNFSSTANLTPAAFSGRYSKPQGG